MERHAMPVARLPAQSLHLLRTAARSPTESSVCVELYFQAGGGDVRTASLLDMLEQTLSEPFFNELRTKQQVRQC
jgi:nardilysin